MEFRGGGYKNIPEYKAAKLEHDKYSALLKSDYTISDGIKEIINASGLKDDVRELVNFSSSPDTQQESALFLKQLAGKIPVGGTAEYGFAFSSTLDGKHGAHSTALYRPNANTIIFFDPNYGEFLVSTNELGKFMTLFLKEKYGVLPYKHDLIKVSDDKKGNDLHAIFSADNRARKAQELQIDTKSELEWKKGPYGKWVQVSGVDKKAVSPQVNNINLTLPFIQEQVGSTCKTTGLANIDVFFSSQLQTKNIPVHKNSKGHYKSELNKYHDKNTDSSISVRQIAKSHGSVQGEILEAEMLQKMAKDMGYKTVVLSPSGVKEFKGQITEQLSQGHPLFACFSVNVNTGLPARDHDTEHACIITGINQETDTITIAHWGKTYHDVPIKDFYESMNALDDIRSPEFYKENPLFPQFSKDKYEELKGQDIQDLGNYAKKSIDPEKAGFKNK